MITPANYHDGITFEEAVDGYLQEGLDRARAEVYARILTSPPDAELPII